MSDQEKRAPLKQDGFLYPFALVVEGWTEWQATGRKPNPLELAQRVPKAWSDDLNHFNELIERGKPAPKEGRA